LDDQLPNTLSGNTGKPYAPYHTMPESLADAAANITGALGAEAFEGDAHALLMAVYKDARQPIELRVAAAKAAIGFERPRLAAIEGKVEGVITLEQIITASIGAARAIRRTSRTDQE
jgi:hypothetical protein